MNEHEHTELPAEVAKACMARQQRLRDLFEAHEIDALLVSFDRGREGEASGPRDAAGTVCAQGAA